MVRNTSLTSPFRPSHFSREKNRLNGRGLQLELKVNGGMCVSDLPKWGVYILHTVLALMDKLRLKNWSCVCLKGSTCAGVFTAFTKTDLKKVQKCLLTGGS